MSQDNPTPSPLETNQPRLPEVLDQPGTFFFYGSLIQDGGARIKRIIEGINEQRRKDQEPEMNTALHFCETIKEVQEKSAAHPGDIMVLTNVAVSGFRVSVVRIGDLNDLYEHKTGKSIEALNDELAFFFETDDLVGDSNCYVLYANSLKKGEKSQPIQGALVMNLSSSIIEILDKYEFCNCEKYKESVYSHVQLHNVIVNDQEYSTDNVHCYGAPPEIQNIHEAIASMRTKELSEKSQKKVMKVMKVMEAVHKGRKEDGNSRKYFAWPKGVRKKQNTREYDQKAIIKNNQSSHNQNLEPKGSETM